MSGPAIEPSEIFTNEKQSFPEEEVLARPLHRLLARYFDYTFFFLCLRLLLGSFVWEIDFIRIIPIEYIAWIPIEAFLIFMWKTTPGKALLGIHVHCVQKFTYRLAMKRSFSVWIRGLGLGIPIVSFFCMLNAYYQFQFYRVNSWDRDIGASVVKRAVSRWRFFVVAIVTVFGMIAYSHWRKFLF